nr:MAG: hypothetical protein DIU78_18785 [Pseudomonadota bacterium]
MVHHTVGTRRSFRVLARVGVFSLGKSARFVRAAASRMRFDRTRAVTRRSVSQGRLAPPLPDSSRPFHAGALFVAVLRMFYDAFPTVRRS